MKAPILIFALGFAAACTPQDQPPAADAEVAAAPQAQAPATSPDVLLPATGEAEGESVQARGVVEEVDVNAGTLTIAHEAIEAYEWPPMTMTFAAPGVDLSGVSAREQVTFQLTRTGAMEGTITSISSDQAAK
ncbi:MAG: copper-binding protein [Pseudomonadota bacterium]|nr:copper-binding protein [Pseudomonadota bacterium]